MRSERCGRPWALARVNVGGAIRLVVTGGGSVASYVDIIIVT